MTSEYVTVPRAWQISISQARIAGIFSLYVSVDSPERCSSPTGKSPCACAVRWVCACSANSERGTMPPTIATISPLGFCSSRESANTASSRYAMISRGRAFLSFAVAITVLPATFPSHRALSWTMRSSRPNESNRWSASSISRTLNFRSLKAYSSS